MRANTKVMSFVFCALVLAFGATAQAQVIHDVTQQNNEVVQYGLTELMGEVRFTAAAVCRRGLYDYRKHNHHHIQWRGNQQFANGY